MSNYQFEPAPKPRKSLKRFILPAVMLLAGVGIGTSAAGGPPETVTVEKRVDVPGPERIVEVPGPERTVTVAAPPVETVPATCLAALDHADAGFNEFAGVMQSILDSNVAGAEAANGRLAKLAPKYNVAKTACRTAGAK